MLKIIIIYLFTVFFIQAQTTTFFHQTTKISDQIITRSTPIINGIPTEGCDHINNNSKKTLFFSSLNKELKPINEFKKSIYDALKKAIAISPTSLIKDPQVQIPENIYEKVWLMHFEQLRAAYKIRLPKLSLFDLQDVYIDAENLEVLKIEPTVHLVSAVGKVFVYHPQSQNINLNELEEKNIENLIDIKEDGFLNGEYINVKNCCHYYTCPSGEKNCPDNQKKCALKSHQNATQSRKIVKIPTELLALNLSFSEIYLDMPHCTYLPLLKASSHNDRLGFYPIPVDDDTQASENDNFSELQVYFSANSFFNHIRTLLDDNTWCLREQAMSCDKSGNAITDDNGVPINPYKIYVNQMMPDVYGQINSDNNIEKQINEQKGFSPEKPVIINDFVRFGNAAFIPALSTVNSNTPKTDEILGDLLKDHDHNVFFQGVKDFAYDGDVVFHEFMHAVITSLVGKPNSLGIDKWGINSEPGSLNEGWADYFAASFSGDSYLGQYTSSQNSYDEISLRNINNNFNCPQNIIGEIHNDSQIWSGALWEIRKIINNKFSASKALEFDRSVLKALALSKKDESFTNQSKKLIEAIEQKSSLGSEIANIAKQVLQKRGIVDCQRIFSLSYLNPSNNYKTDIKNILFIPSKNNIGLKNYAPANIQLKIDVPAGTDVIDISFEQEMAVSGPSMGKKITDRDSNDLKPIAALFKLNEPIQWDFKSALAKPIVDENSKEDIKKISYAFYKDNRWHITQKIDSEYCEQQSIYLSLLGQDYTYALKDIKVSFIKKNNFNSKKCKYFYFNKLKESGCSSTNANSFLLLSVMLLACYKLRRKA